MVTMRLGPKFNTDPIMKIWRSFLFMAITALTLAGCSKDEIAPMLPTEEVSIQFNAQSAETRTVFGTPTEGVYPTLWTANQSVKISLNLASAKDVTSMTVADDQKSAHFEATISDDNSGAYTFYALSPAVAHNSVHKDNNYWSVKIPETQTPLENSCDEAAQILLAKSETTNTLPSMVDLRFKHVTAYGKLTLKNLPADVKVSSIALTSDVEISGRFNYLFESNTLAVNSASKTLTIHTDKTSDVWFAIAPVDLSGKPLKVVVTTNRGVITKEIAELPATCDFNAGVVSNITLNMSDLPIVEPEKYTLMTDVAQLKVGYKVIIAATDVAISTTQNSNNRAAAAVTKEGNFIVAPNDAVQIFRVEPGTKENTFAFNTGSGYIYAASSSGNHMKTQQTLDDNASWAISIADGVTNIVAQGANARNVMRYNASNSLFSCYGSASQKAVSLYYLEAAAPTQLATPVVTATVQNTNEIVVSWEAVPNAGSYTVSCGDLGPVTVTDATTYTFKELQTATEYTVSVVAVPSDKEKYLASAAGTATATTGGAIVYTTIAEIHAAAEEGTYNIKDVTVVAVGAKTALLKDATGYLFSFQTLDVAVGDVINILNATTSTYGKRQIKSGAEVEKVGTTTVNHPTATVVADGAAFTALSQNYGIGDYVQVTASELSVGSYINFTVTGATVSGSLIIPTEDLSAYNGLPVTITGYCCYLSGSYFYLFPTEVKSEPYLKADPSAISWTAEDTTAKTVTISTDAEAWTVQSAPEWVTATRTNATTLTITPNAANTGAARTGEVILQHATEAITATVKVEHQGANALATYEWVLVSNDLNNENLTMEKGTPAITWNMAYTWQTEDFYFGFDNNNGRGAQIGSGSKPVATATFSTTGFADDIQKVTVNAATASSGNCTITVTVGGTALTCENNALTTTATDYVFTAATPLKGKVVITYTNNAKKAVYLKSITINK